MSKRIADGLGGLQRYGGMEQPRDEEEDLARKATAAQLAKRSIKPLKGRPASASRSSSPSKASFSLSFPNPFGGADTSPFAQSAPAPPAAASFKFGQSQATQPQANRFGPVSISQSFPPNAPANAGTTTNNNNNNNNPATTFTFGQSQPANAPSFTLPQASTFTFSQSQPANTPSFAPPQASTFTFGTTPSSAASSNNPFSAMSGPSFGGEQPISAAEIDEIESSGPRLSQEGKLEQLADIVRQSEPKYKDADLGGLKLEALPAAVQRKMLDFVRGKTDTIQTQPEASEPFSSFSSTAPVPAASTSFAFGASTTAASFSSQPEYQPSPFGGFGGNSYNNKNNSFSNDHNNNNNNNNNNNYSNNYSNGNAFASPAPSSGFQFGSTAEPTRNNDMAPATSAFGGFGASTAQRAETPARAPTVAFNFGASNTASLPAQPSTSSFNFGAAAAASASAAPVAPPSPKPVEKNFPTFAFGVSAAPKPAEQVSDPALNFTRPEQNSTPAPSFNFGQSAAPASLSPFKPVAPATSSPFKPAAAPVAPATSSPFKPAAAPVTLESPRPQSAGLGSSIFDKPSSAQQKPAESAFKGFGASSQSSAPSSSFGFGASSQSSAPSSSFGFGASVTTQAPAPAPPGRSQPRKTTTFTKSTDASGVATPPDSPQLLPSELASALIKQLNESLRAHLASADSSQDWTSTMHYYLEQVSNIRHENSAAPSTADLALVTRGEKRVAEEEVTKEQDHNKRSKMTFSTSTTPTKPLSTTASLIDNILNSGDNPQTPQQTNFSSAGADKTPAPPATAPQTKSKSFGIIPCNVSATPAPTMSKTARLPPAGAQALPSSNTGALNLAKPSLPTPSPFQIKPATSTSNAPSSAAAPAFQIPKFGGSSAGAPPSFLGSFGKKAAEQEAKEREERKAEDMDSDEDEEEWERKDAEKQAQKKADLLAASQALKFNVDTSKKADGPASAVFSFGATPSSTTINNTASSNMFANISSTNPDEDDYEGDTDEDESVHAAHANASPAEPSAGKSLFDRVSFDTEKEKTSDAPSASFKFGSSGSSGPAVNITLNESNPIKFGASTATAGTSTPDGSPAKGLGASLSSAIPAPAPKFSFGGVSQPAGKSSVFSGVSGAKGAESPKPASSGSIFDAAKPSGSTAGFSFGGASTSAPSGLAPPSGSSVFASAATSRATTPGAVTTAAESSAGESEPSDVPNDAQQKDLTALTADDVANFDLLFEVRSKVTKFVKSSNHKGEDTSTWVPQGVGPIRILASKDTCKPRILLRADPSGKVVLNFNALLNKDLYKHKGGKVVQLSVPAENKKVESWLAYFKDENKAKEFVNALQEGIAKAQG